MEKYLRIIMLILIIFYSCKENKKFNHYDCSKSINHEDCISSTKTLKKLTKEELSAYNVAIEFIIWYCSSEVSLVQKKIIQYNNETGVTLLDSVYTDKYIHILKNNKLLSEYFIEYMIGSIYEYKDYLEFEKELESEEVTGFEFPEIVFNLTNSYCSIENPDIIIEDFRLLKDEIEISFNCMTIWLIKDKEDNWVIEIAH